MKVILLLVAVVALGACARQEPEPAAATPAGWDGLWAGGTSMDTLGVADIAQGDTTGGREHLTIIETTIGFATHERPAAALAWEFFATDIQPVKLIVVRYDRQEQRYELIGESATVIPRQRGLNRFILREPIPVEHRDRFGLIMPEGAAIPFKRVLNWRALITTRPLERPYLPRDQFATYGWRYSARVFYRVEPAESDSLK